MSVVETNETVSQEDSEILERDYWKQQADIRGLSYPKNIALDKLRDLVKARIAEEQITNSNDGTRGRRTLEKLAPEVLARLDEATRLVRYSISVLDPSKQEWTGLIVTAGNDNFAPIRRTIPLNAPIWHAEAILLEVLKSMKYTYRKTDRHPRLRESFQSEKNFKLMPCFKITELPPLTEEELKALAEAQASNQTGQNAED